MARESFDVSGMSCAACSSRVQKAVSALAGVEDVSVNLLKNSMRVRFQDDRVGVADIVAAVEQAGYGATPRTAPSVSAPKSDPAADTLHLMRQRLLLSLGFLLPLLYLSMGSMLGLPLPSFFTGRTGLLPFALTQLLLTMPIVAINFHFFRNGGKTLLAGAPNMDSLVALGSGAAAIFGIYALYRIAFALGTDDPATAKYFAEHLYFESAAMILTLITLGKYLEARAKGKTSDAIARLMELAPGTATVLRDGQEVQVPLETLAAGDILVVKAGERIPVDGIITEGHASLDESAITGESLPQEKTAGDPVTGATISRSGHFLMRATRVGEDTTLAQIIRLVDEASSSKAPISRLADRISGIFVPAVIAIALAAGVVWLLLGQGMAFALSISIAVLVISCPCALGLATPTAIMVGTGRGAACGILFKSAEAIETSGQISTVVLDKTGTVTEGRPALTDLLTIPDCPPDDMLVLAASLEKLSGHPLGLALVQAAEQRGLPLLPVEAFTQTPGQGIAGSVNGQFCQIGNAALLQAAGLENIFSAKADAFAADGKTPLYCVRDGKLLGVAAVADTIKPSSRQAVAALKALGMDVILLTGDNAGTAQAIARQAGISHVLSDLLPQDKEREIRRLQQEGKKVAMAGDGINDAPALARADVGIALGAGTDIAMESADIVLMRNDLLDVAGAIQLSRAVMRIIRENLFWAFFYNSLGIPVAAGALYSLWHITLNPMIAAAAMSFSSVSVVSNALRLRFFTPRYPDAATTAAARTTGHETPLPPSSTTVPPKEVSMKKVITIEGMHCAHCSGAVEKALNALDGTQNVSVDLAAKKASLEVTDAVSDALLRKAVTDAGFTVVSIQ